MSFGPLLRFDVPEPGRIVGLPFGLEAERRFGDRAYSRAAMRGSLGTDGNALKVALVADARARRHAAVGLSTRSCRFDGFTVGTTP